MSVGEKKKESVAFILAQRAAYERDRRKVITGEEFVEAKRRVQEMSVRTLNDVFRQAVIA